MILNRTELVKRIAKVFLSLVVAISLMATPVANADAAKATKNHSKKKDAKKKASIYDAKTNSVKIKLNGFKNRQDIVVKFYEKQENGKFKKIKTIKGKNPKKDTFKYKHTINEKSFFEYGKTYKYVVKSKMHYVENKNLIDVINEKRNQNIKMEAAFNTNQKLLSDGEKQSFKAYGKVLHFQNKTSTNSKTFKTISKRKRLLRFSKKYKKYTYSQAKRHTKGFADCSSFIYALYKDIGMHLGGDGANTETELAWCEKNALKVKLSRAKLGDLIFYSDEETDTFEEHYKHVTHVAIFKDNKTIMEMTGDGVNFRTRTVSTKDSDCIAVYRPIYDSKDYIDKDYNKQKIKKGKKEKEKEHIKKLKKKHKYKKAKKSDNKRVYKTKDAKKEDTIDFNSVEFETASEE